MGNSVAMGCNGWPRIATLLGIVLCALVTVVSQSRTSFHALLFRRRAPT